MTDEQRQEIERLDRWLAVQEVTGVRFETIESRRADTWKGGCAVIRYHREIGYPGEDFSSFCFRVLPLGHTSPLYRANDASDGNPQAVRAALHKMFPFLTETPALTEVPTHA